MHRANKIDKMRDFNEYLAKMCDFEFKNKGKFIVLNILILKISIG